MTDEVVWPDPVDVTAFGPGPASDLDRAGTRAAVVRYEVAVAVHRRHEGTGGDPDCEWCVFTEDGFQTHNCRSCSRPIVWATTEDRKLMPVDASEDPEGNVVIYRAGGEVRVIVLDQDALFGDGTRRTSHFATCPDADSWRTRRSR